MNDRVPIEDLINRGKKRGNLAKQLYVIFTKPAAGMSSISENLAAHLKFQNQLEHDGIMFAAGPTWTDDELGWEGEGMVVIRAESLEKAREIANRDPMHSSGARTFTIRPWLVNEGMLTIQVGFSAGRFELV